MEYVLIIHEVKDYETWKKIFDDAASIRKEAGEQSYQILKYDNNANKIVHFLDGYQLLMLRHSLSLLN
jgi:hypothetical protein